MPASRSPAPSQDNLTAFGVREPSSRLSANHSNCQIRGSPRNHRRNHCRRLSSRPQIIAAFASTACQFYCRPHSAVLTFSYQSAHRRNTAAPEASIDTTSTSPATTANIPAAPRNTSAWKWIFRVLRWSTYAVVLITLVLALHKSAPPLVDSNPQAAARAEEKFQQVERDLSSHQPSTLRLDETELNSYLASHLVLEGGAPSANAAATPGESSPSAAPSGAPTAADVEQMRSNVRDVKVQLIEDRVRAYVVFDMHGKDMTLQLEGRLGAANGFLRFEPVSGHIGALPIPQGSAQCHSALESAVQRLMDSPENR
jgi:type IV secretory pathway VirB10-like protein